MGGKKREGSNDISCQVCGANDRRDKVSYVILEHLKFTSGIPAKPTLPLCRRCKDGVNEGEIDPQRYLGSPTEKIGDFEMRNTSASYKPKHDVASTNSEDIRPAVNGLYMRKLQQAAQQVDVSAGGMEELRWRNRGLR